MKIKKKMIRLKYPLLTLKQVAHADFIYEKYYSFI